MMVQGAVHATFVVQLALVTAFFLLAAVRTRRIRRSGVSEVTPTVMPRRARSDGPSVPDEPEEARLERLAEERERLTRDLERLRAAHADEEASFRTRRREALLEMQEYRRISAALGAELPGLQDRMKELRAEVEHLEHRRSALADEIVASAQTSSALRDRTALAQRELASLHVDRERVARRIRSDGQRLRDLSQRRELVRAENEELSALLDLLQQLSGQPGTLTSLSDGELRGGRAVRAHVAGTDATPRRESARTSGAGSPK
jgi:predicted  nucleic acid-binding Zn-ribbon protein